MGMMAKPNRLKVPTPEDYLRATAEIDTNNPEVFDFIEKIGDDARSMPKSFLQILGILARKAYPPQLSDETIDEKPVDIARPTRLRVCRALGFGAALGALVASVAHEWPDALHDCGNFAVIDRGAEDADEFIADAHGLVDELEAIIGTPTREWLEKRADNTAMTGNIDDSFRSWFVIGAAQSLGLLYSNAVMYEE
jgi:hypothetical protein